nr:hypothetical protein Iba_chr08bCG5180 [Ipomoea batatas]
MITPMEFEIEALTSNKISGPSKNPSADTYHHLASSPSPWLSWVGPRCQVEGFDLIRLACFAATCHLERKVGGGQALVPLSRLRDRGLVGHRVHAVVSSVPGRTPICPCIACAAAAFLRMLHNNRPAAIAGWGSHLQEFWQTNKHTVFEVNETRVVEFIAHRGGIVGACGWAPQCSPST